MWWDGTVSAPTGTIRTETKNMRTSSVNLEVLEYLFMVDNTTSRSNFQVALSVLFDSTTEFLYSPDN